FNDRTIGPVIFGSNETAMVIVFVVHIGRECGPMLGEHSDRAQCDQEPSLTSHYQRTDLPHHASPARMHLLCEHYACVREGKWRSHLSLASVLEFLYPLSSRMISS